MTETQGRFRVVQREIPTAEGIWRRGGDLSRVKGSELEAALPAGLRLEALAGLAVVAHSPEGWRELPFTLDLADGYGRWIGGAPAPDSLLCFHAPGNGTPPKGPWARAGEFEGEIPLRLWDSRGRAWLDGVSVFYRTGSAAPPVASSLRLEEDARGYAVTDDGAMLLHFAADRGFQIDFAGMAGTNLAPEGRTWRWLLTETPDELAHAQDCVTFTPQVVRGPVLVATISAEAAAGRMTATLRIFRHGGTLALELSDYRTVRTRPELPPEQHTRSYAGQVASIYPGVHYAVLMLEMADAEAFDHLYQFGALPIDGPLDFVYTGDRVQRGWNWVALCAEHGAAGIAAHGRSHFPDHPFKAGTVDGRRVLALEPFGSEVDGHYHSCDRFMLLLADGPDGIREAFDTLDTYPLLAAVPLRRELAFLDTFACLGRWTNLVIDHLLPAHRNVLLTDGRYRDAAESPLAPISELVRLYEKTGHTPFLDAAKQAADFTAGWILDGKFLTRGTGIDPNGGGIYQNEQIYLILALARVAQHTGDPRLTQAMQAGVQCLQDTRGGVGTWNWAGFAWHAGGFDAQGKPLYHWPVNSNEFATLCFRLYQMTGERGYYDQAMEIVDAYLARLKPDSWEIIMGGGVSDTTRGVHFLAEVLEAAGDDPRIDRAFWTEAVRNTLERFWVEGWVQVRHSVYGEVIHAGDTPGEIFSPGFDHWHNCGSALDILPRMQVAAEVGVSEHLTHWAMRDFALDFDARYGSEEHTHLMPYSIRDTDIEPASWLDCELLPTLYAVRRRGWVDDEDFRQLHYKIHRMVQRTFLSLDDAHGGWASTYDSHDGAPVKYLTYWEHRHSYERYGADEPRELWGMTTRDAFYDHSTRYWNPQEQLVDELVKVAASRVEGNLQIITVADDGPAAGLPLARPLLAVKDAAAVTIEGGWRITEQREIGIGGVVFWLLAVERA